MSPCISTTRTCNVQNALWKDAECQKVIFRAGGVAMRSGDFELFELLATGRYKLPRPVPSVFAAIASTIEVLQRSCVRIMHVPNNHNKHGITITYWCLNPTGWKAASDWNRVNAAHPRRTSEIRECIQASSTALIIQIVSHIFDL